MAVQLLSENLTSIAPRTSFSHDPRKSNTTPMEKIHLRSSSSRLDSNIEFNFRVSKSFDQEFSSADELFSNGKILPVDIKKKSSAPLPPPRDFLDGLSINDRLKKERLIEAKVTSTEELEANHYRKQSSNKSFWQFKRSSSLNCIGGLYGRNLCSFPLLPRSKSTGSAQNVKQNSQKMKSSSSMSYQKPPLKNYGNGIRVTNSVLNVPLADLFCLGSVFPSSKNKKR